MQKDNFFVPSCRIYREKYCKIDRTYDICMFFISNDVESTYNMDCFRIDPDSRAFDRYWQFDCAAGKAYQQEIFMCIIGFLGRYFVDVFIRICAMIVVFIVYVLALQYLGFVNNVVLVLAGLYVCTLVLSLDLIAYQRRMGVPE